jgi:multidrug efflux pump subunit AcrA (membrane-fusion protein)
MIQLEMKSARRSPALVRLALGALALGLLTLGVLVTGCGRTAGGGKVAGGQHQSYHCPMHPTYVSDRPGDCPICGMKLVPFEPKAPADSSAPAEATGPRRILHYRNPMDPSVTSPVPMKDPMGMDYVPVYSDEVSGAGLVEGRAPVEVSPDELRLSGIQTAVARRGALARAIRTVGEVKADEARVHLVQSRVSGWVERLFVGSRGQAVRRGQPLLSLYSPELLATQEEFLRARESAARFAGSEVPEVRRGGAELLEAARRRLLLFGVPESFVVALERSGQPQRAVTLESPASGFLTTKDVYAGSQVQPGATLFTVTDLSRVWVEGAIHEYEAPLVRLGQAARVTLPNGAARAYSGRIRYVDPVLDPDTRTLKVRLELDNPGLALKPGMFADVELDAQVAEGVLVPDAAVLDAGTRQIVYVKTGEGRYAPRQVTVGVRNGGQAQILSGLKAGEVVVDRANFLLDSESRLRAANGSAQAAGATGKGAR